LTNGDLAFIQSETKHLADHAGLSQQLNLFQIDSVLLDQISFFHLKMQYLVTLLAWDAMVDGYGMSGSTCKTKESLPICAIHTPQEMDLLANAKQIAPLLSSGRNISQLTSINQAQSLKFKKKSMPMDQLKLHSPSMLTL